MRITKLHAREILDSRGNPTLEVELTAAHGTARASVPSGASTGVYEARELRDGGHRYDGLGVRKALRNVTGPIAASVRGKQFDTQQAFDAHLCALDGTQDKRKLGANAILGCSIAFARLLALERKIEVYESIARDAGTKPRLPVIFANVLNGGKHAGTGLSVQEFMIVSRAKHFSESVEEIARTYHALKRIITKHWGGAATGLGDEGGFAPPAASVTDALKLLEEARRAAGTTVSFALDAAASEFYVEKKHAYLLDGAHKTPEELVREYTALVKRFGIVSFEDPFEQHSFSDFAALRAALRAARLSCQVVGDDLTVTNPARVREAITRASCDCLLLKVNQIGTITEAIDAARTASEAGWRVMVSHRSGETDGAFIAHLAVGLGCGQMKIGAPARGERAAKYNELLRIGERVKTYRAL